MSKKIKIINVKSNVSYVDKKVLSRNNRDKCDTTLCNLQVFNAISLSLSENCEYFVKNHRDDETLIESFVSLPCCVNPFPVEIVKK